MKIDDIDPIALDLSTYHIQQSGLLSKRYKIGIVVSQFNDAMTSRLLKGALGYLQSVGIVNDDIIIAYVPGAFELPLKAQQLLNNGCAGVICLGCVIRGDTSHFDYVAGECARGIMTVSLAANKPVIFGVLTTDTVDQAFDRCQNNDSNKGLEAASSLVQLLSSLAR
tara:strand:+ start:760 stop:1260 length:501 start_codon:yes stop_codon:yes gene_type:complete